MAVIKGNVILESTFNFIDSNKSSVIVDLFEGTILNHKQFIDKDGYLYIKLKGKTIRSHHIVSYFIFGERMIGKQINHLDGFKSNNKPHNLELSTPSENIKHAFRTGLKIAAKGEASTSSKIKEKDVIEIRKLKRQGKTLKEIGNIFGISFQQVSRICSGERWNHIPLDLDEDLASIDFDKFQSLSSRTANTNLEDFLEVCNYALGLISESGEVSDLVKKQLFHGHEIDKEKIEDELGDVLWYMSNLATKYGISLKGIAIRNIEKLKARYPDGFDVEKSINRVEE